MTPYDGTYFSDWPGGSCNGKDEPGLHVYKLTVHRCLGMAMNGVSEPNSSMHAENATGDEQFFLKRPPAQTVVRNDEWEVNELAYIPIHPVHIGRA